MCFADWERERLLVWRRIEPGQCELLITAGSASCEADFCPDCEGTTGLHEGAGEGGHQHGECDLTCGLCQVDDSSAPAAAAAAAAVACSDEPTYYPRESLPDGYLWETPMSSEMLADSIVIMSNTVGASVILASGKKFFQAEPQKEYEMAMRFFKEGHGMCAAYIVLLAAGTFVAILVASEILDTWVALYALSTALSLLWSLKNGAENASVCDAIFI
jgi:hypothetical protein